VDRAPIKPAGNNVTTNTANLETEPFLIPGNRATLINKEAGRSPPLNKSSTSGHCEVDAVLTGFPSPSYSCTVPNFASTSRVFEASPTATICR
jgi:hypothetical protein